MNSLIISLRCILPIVILILLGYCLKRIGFITDTGAAQMDKLSFRVLLPAMLFRSVISADFSRDMDVRLILIALGVSVYSFVAAVVLSYFKCRGSGPARASMAQAILRNNAVVFGMSLITSMYGEAATGVFSMLLAFVIPLNNVLTVAMMSWLTNRGVSPLKVIRGIVTNPFVLAVAAGLLVQALGIKLPSFGTTVVNDLAGAGAAIALIGLGAAIRFQDVDKNAWGDIAYGVVSRLIILPLTCIPVVLLLGVRGIPLVALFALVATPTAESSYVMAREMGADATLAGRLVVFQTVLSPLTLLIGFTVFSACGFI